MKIPGQNGARQRGNNDVSNFEVGRPANHVASFFLSAVDSYVTDGLFKLGNLLNC